MSVRQQPPAPDRADRADRAPPTNALWSDALTIPPGVKIAAQPPTRPVSLYAAADAPRARARVAPTRRRASAGDALDLDAMFAAKAALLRPTAGRAAYDDAEEQAPMPSFTLSGCCLMSNPDSRDWIRSFRDRNLCRIPTVVHTITLLAKLCSTSLMPVKRRQGIH